MAFQLVLLTKNNTKFSEKTTSKRFNMIIVIKTENYFLVLKTIWTKLDMQEIGGYSTKGIKTTNNIN